MRPYLYGLTTPGSAAAGPHVPRPLSGTARPAAARGAGAPLRGTARVPSCAVA